jgi:NAD(P)-dependent dehydrogenase (short-subunit alcohol dehydrogenase family)
MAGRMAGKKVFVTGGAQGLGAAIASAVAAEGGKVAVADINAAGAEKTAAAINAAHGAGTASSYALDVTNEEQWIAALEAANTAMGGISGLVNNAGIAGDKAAWKNSISRRSSAS